MASKRPAEWQLPTGVSPGLWEYLHAEELAKGYDAALKDAPLARFDSQFLREVLPRPGMLVDLGCGAGRHVVELAHRGFDVVGVDLAEPMLRVARERATATNVTVNFVRANLVQLDALRDGSFDYVICMFSTLGLIQGEANRERVIRHAHRLLRPGGRFVLHVHNYWFNLWQPQARRWLVKDVLKSILPGRWSREQIMPFHQGVANLSMHLFTKSELYRLLLRAGFRSVQTRPISLRPDGRLRCPWWFGGLRAYGHFAVADK